MIAWAIAVASFAALVDARRRLARVADVEHEVRGALTAVALAAHRHRDAGLEAAVARGRAALGGRGGTTTCLERLVRSSVRALAPANDRNHGDLRRLRGLRVAEGAGAVVLGNLVANAAEHGSGGLVVRIEVANRRSLNGFPAYGRQNRSAKRGRGLRIAARAARAAGGRLDVGSHADRFAAAVELPLEP